MSKFSIRFEEKVEALVGWQIEYLSAFNTPPSDPKLVRSGDVIRATVSLGVSPNLMLQLGQVIELLKSGTGFELTGNITEVKKDLETLLSLLEQLDGAIHTKEEATA